MKFAVVQMLGLVEGEQTFSTFSLKSKLRNCLNEYLNNVVGIYFQFFYSLNIFP
jgi:hypothetical protein